MLLTYGALPLSCLCTMFFFGVHAASVLITRHGPFATVHCAIENSKKQLQMEHTIPGFVHATVAVCWALYTLYVDPARAEGAGDAGPFAVR